MKPNLFRLLVGLFLAGVYACQTEKSSTNQVPEMPKDQHSASRPLEAVVTHTHLNLHVDFDKKEISGLAILTVDNKVKGTELLLDTRNLEIKNVFLGDESHPTKFELQPEQKFLGRALKITIEPQQDQKVMVRYRTTAQSDALQWLDPSQTAGKQHPFLFTQGQAILSRTWFPCQDSPGIRFTYSADVHVPKGLRPIMSAEISRMDTVNGGTFHFEMSRPIPAYLVALSVGDLGFKDIDKRTGVYAEPSMIDKSAFEFSEMGKMVDAAESIYGSYRWGRYDVLVLPPSFPFGGMENPCVTFATPTILAGDKSLTSLIAHELAHSWSGNLVTNANWNDFWLNEGFTVYFERRIMEKLEGKEYADMLALLGYEDLKETMDEMGQGSPDTHLKLSLDGRDPDDGMNDVAYEKGYLFLCHMEKLAGRQKWDAFVKQYFEEFAFQSMTTERFVEYLNTKLLIPNKISADQANIDNWIYKPGVPSGVEVPKSTRFEAAEKVATEFAGSGKVDLSQISKWSSHEWLHFLRSLPPKMSTDQMQNLDKQFQFSKSGNSELLFEWLMMSVRNQYRTSYPAMENFLVNTGRRKFVLPIYKALIANKKDAELAKQIFVKAKPNYHSVTYSSIENLFK